MMILAAADAVAVIIYLVWMWDLHRLCCSAPGSAPNPDGDAH
jgi:hypothetical protein